MDTDLFSSGGTIKYIIITVVVIIVILVPVIILATRNAGKKGQNRFVKKIIANYEKLAQAIGAPMPERFENKGYLSYPKLRIKRLELDIVVTPEIFNRYSNEPGYLARNPYGETNSLSMARRPQNAKNMTSQITTVKMTLPPKYRGTGLLIRTESLLGNLVNYTEIKVGDSNFDKTFSILGQSKDLVESVLTPQLREALLKFRKDHGKFQLNDRQMIWIKTGHGTSGIEYVIKGFEEVAKSFKG
ncbi:MAG: DUF3137 domain-containing protein [Bacteroidota bacterium]